MIRSSFYLRIEGVMKVKQLQRPGSRKGCYAFTLVELLVVVAIIALLVSILLPTLNKAKEQTSRVICASNLRNCGTALHLYTASNNGYFPPHYDDWVDPHMYCRQGVYDLREYIRPYVGDFNLWKCAALTMTASIGDSDNTRDYCYGTYRYYPGRKYPQFADPGIDPDQYNNPQPQPNRYENVDNAASRVMVQDAFVDDWMYSENVRFNHGQGKVTRCADPTTPSYACKVGSFGSGDGANLLFYDGHAEWFWFRELEPVGRSASDSGAPVTYSRLP